MSSPSASSGSSFQTRYQESATSSGRTTPDPSHHASSSSYQPSKAMAMAQPQPQPPRRSSTPASSFLAPRFFGGYPYDSMVGASANQQASSNTSGAGGSGSGAPNGPPRRTSFGTSLGGRLSALSSLGFGGGAWSQPPTSPSLQHQAPASQTSSAAASPMLRPADKTAATPVTASTEGGKARGAQQVEKRHICVPDGCGGFVTVERRDRRPSQA
ncbi:hypothetical protein BCV69DRAFT_298355 [Microstroma glucosiphilum]|uniref:Uncharacterized protein n=1 Tax=Pseudomicrostroma glucosiphilum TaxID=1684307 RepID=A0A316UA28_9BASI|nr:hypothetical protein BCV69DRAFT_298355 [Pseudomicrostroma glucosiphilum]PWN21331.1 hypothetical protein BCV69DRAFT_298355 [Pseudomicrostroma glucosiphilum]